MINILILCLVDFFNLRDWSIIMGRGGGARELLPLLKGGNNNFWGIFYAVA